MSASFVAVAVPFTAEQYSQGLLCGITRTLNDAGVGTLCISGKPCSSAAEVEQAGFELAKGARVREVITLGGLMFKAPGSAQQFVRSLDQRAIVNIGSEIPGVPNVLSDNQGGVVQAVQHLFGLGRRRIAFVRGQTLSTDAAERYRGYQDALELCNLDFDPSLVCVGAFVAESGRKAVQVLIDERRASIDAIVAANDDSALGAMRALKRRGLRIPEDVAVVGFDDLIDAAGSDPPLTTISQALTEQGACAARMLLAMREGQSFPRRTILPTKLLVRGSCGGRGHQATVPRLEVPAEPIAEWYARHKRLLGECARQYSGFSLEDQQVIDEFVEAIVVQTTDTESRLRSALAKVPEQMAWRVFMVLNVLRNALGEVLVGHGDLSERLIVAFRRAEQLAFLHVEASEARTLGSSFAGHAAEQALTSALVGSRSEKDVLVRLARYLEDHPQIVGYHVTKVERDPAWSQLVITSALGVGPSSEGATRFRTETLLPEGALPAQRPLNLCAAEIRNGAAVWGNLILEVLPAYTHQTGLLSDQISLWLTTHLATQQQEASRSETDEPRWIGRYRVQRCVGTGGAASVYLAHNEVAGVARPVAIKVFNAPQADLEQLLEEARIAASIRHPNVVQVIELGESTDGVFLVMDFVDGCNLSSLLCSAMAQQQRIPRRIVGRVLVDALSGLHAAHELKDADGHPLHLVHRDISLHNILVDVDGVTRITDFGIAKTHLYDDVTEDGVVKGKLRYMAPEQLRFESLDRRADLFSIGVVAWELLAGRRLYEGDRKTVLRRRIASDPPPRLSSVEPTDAAIDDLLVRALEVNPDRRPATAKELRGLVTVTFEAHGGLADAEEVGSYVVQQTDGKERLRRLDLD